MSKNINYERDTEIEGRQEAKTKHTEKKEEEEGFQVCERECMYSHTVRRIRNWAQNLNAKKREKVLTIQGL